MKLKLIKTCILSTMLAALVFASGILLGSYQEYNRGYHDGQKVTNSWWIGKQSRYYDSVEVEKKRSSKKYDLL